MLYMVDNRTTARATVTKVGTIEINKKLYHSVQLSETIFHPKGGGQLPDEGTIGGIKVAYVHKDQIEIHHCFNEPIPFQIGDEVDLVVNSEIRHLHSRLHTAGHLLAEAVNKCYPELEAYQGNHYPENSYVRFKILDFFRNLSPQDLTERGKARSKRSGPNEESPMAIAMGDEEDRSGKASSRQIPGESFEGSRFSPLQNEIDKQAVEKHFTAWIRQDCKVESKLEQGVRRVKVYQNWSLCGGTHVNSLKEIERMGISNISFNKKEGIVSIKYTL